MLDLSIDDLVKLRVMLSGCAFGSGWRTLDRLLKTKRFDCDLIRAVVYEGENNSA